MKTKTYYLFIFTLFLAISMSGCKKEKEITKEERREDVSGVWELVEFEQTSINKYGDTSKVTFSDNKLISVNQYGYDIIYYKKYINLKKDGTVTSFFERERYYSINSFKSYFGIGTEIETGTWNVVNMKENTDYSKEELIVLNIKTKKEKFVEKDGDYENNTETNYGNSEQGKYKFLEIEKIGQNKFKTTDSYKSDEPYQASQMDSYSVYQRKL